MKKIYAVSVTSILTVALFFGAMPGAMAGIATPEGHNAVFNPASKLITILGTIQALIGVTIPQNTDVTGNITYHVEDKDSIQA